MLNKYLYESGNFWVGKTKHIRTRGKILTRFMDFISDMQNPDLFENFIPASRWSWSIEL